MIGKIIPAFFILFLMYFSLAGQNKEERNELIGLLNQRQEMFDRYAESLKKKSGFFGQKTRNDLRATHDKLKAIVEVDNKIMTRLRQLLDFSRFEKQTMSYDVNEYSAQLKNYERNHDTLVKQLAQLEKENTFLNKSKSKSSSWLYFLFGFLFAVAIYFMRRKFIARRNN